MDGAEHRRQQAVFGHGVEDARLAQHHDQDDRGQAGDGADFDNGPQPGHLGAEGINRHRDRVRDIQIGVFDDAGQHEGDDDIKHGADGQRSQDANGHVALGVLGLLRRRRDGVKANVSEEDDARPRAARRPSRSGAGSRGRAGTKGCQLARLM